MELAVAVHALVVAKPELGTAQREVHLEDGLERLPVGVVLHQRRGQGVLERLTILEGNVLHRLHGVEVLCQRHRESRSAQLLNEPRQQVQHGSRTYFFKGSSTESSLVALAMSVWYLSRMCSVSLA